MLIAGSVLAGCSSPRKYEAPCLANAIYKQSSLLKSNYTLNENELEKKSQVREEILGYFGLKNFLILPDKLNLCSAIDMKVDLKLLKLEDALKPSENNPLLNKAYLNLNIKF